MCCFAGYILESSTQSQKYPYVGEWRSALLYSNNSYLCMMLNVSTFKEVDLAQTTVVPGDQEIFVYVDLLVSNKSRSFQASQTTVFALNVTSPSRYLLLSEIFLGEQWDTSSIAQVVVYASVNTILSNVTIQTGSCPRNRMRE